MSPSGHLASEPVAESVEPEVKQPLRLALEGGNLPNNLLVEPLWDYVGVDIGDKPVFVVALGDVVDNVGVTAGAVVYF